MRTFSLIFALLISVSSTSLADTVRFSPDSQLIGELKRLERGRVYFDTDATGIVPIEMDNILGIESSQLVRLEMSDGAWYLGYLKKSDSDGYANFESESGVRSIKLDDVVLMTPIEADFVERIDGEINAGLSFTKDSEVLQTNFGVVAEYVSDDYELNLAADSIITRDSANESSHRSAVELSTLRRLHGSWAHWSAGLRVNFERNDGLGTDLRSSFGGGVQRALRQTNSQRVELAGGILYTRERVAGGSSSEESVEGVFSIDYGLFRYDAPEVDLSAKLEVIPNFSEWGRVRSNFDLTLKWEVYEDLFLRLSFYDSFDSDPPSLEADRNDYGVITGVAWEF